MTITLNNKLLIKLVEKKEGSPLGFSGDSTGSTEYLKGIIILEPDADFVHEGDTVYFPKAAGQKIDTGLFSDIKDINPVEEYVFLDYKNISLLAKVAK